MLGAKTRAEISAVGLGMAGALLKVCEKGLRWQWEVWGQEQPWWSQSHPEPHAGFGRCFSQSNGAVAMCG